MTVFSASGKVVARQKVRKGHQFRFPLAAGTYKLNAGTQLHPKGGCPPTTIQLRGGRTTRVTVKTGCSVA